MTTPVLTIEHLTLTQQHISLVHDISFSVEEGQIVTLIGPNGAGKSSIVKAALGLLAPTSGTVSLRPGLRIGYMPQKLRLNEHIPLQVSRFLTLVHPHSTEKLLTILDQVGVKHLYCRDMHALSGGELQRVLLARALLNEPELLILDEPVQGVDVAGQSALYHLIQEIRHRYRCAILLVSHDLHFVMAATDHVVCLNHHVCCSGHPNAVSQHPAYLALFGQPLASEFAIYKHHHDHQHL